MYNSQVTSSTLGHFRRNPSWLNHWLLFSNELVDALPVHQFVIEKGSYEKFSLQRRKRREQGDRSFVEVTGEPSTPLLGGYFELVTIDLSSNIYPDGYRSD